MNTVDPKRQFERYAAAYDTSDEKIRLKLVHMHKVAGIARVIAVEEGFEGREVSLAYTLGLYHDIGRFGQLRRFGTFSDAKSVDHALLSVQIIESEGMLGQLAQPDRKAVLAAIQNHNRLAIDLAVAEPFELAMCKIIRDADKVDIFRVLCESSLGATFEVGQGEIEAAALSAEVVACLDAGRSVPLGVRSTPLDKLAGTLGFVYDLNYGASARMVLDQGHWRRVLERFDYTDLRTKSEVARLICAAERHLVRLAGKK